VTWVALLLRWLHILPAVAAGGASIYAAIALLPTLAELPEEVRNATRDRILARWRPIVSLSVALLLGSGLANFILFQSKMHTGQPLYHGVFGVKFLAALAVFFISSAARCRTPSGLPSPHT